MEELAREESTVETMLSARSVAVLRVTVAVACALIVVHGTFALDPDTSLADAGIRSWSSEQGLPVNTVVDVIQDQQGYVWFATEQGLTRFDGNRFEVFDHASTPGVGWDYIRSLAETEDGTVWAGTNGGGLIRYRDGEFTTLTTADGLPDNLVWSIAAIEGGGLWVGTDTGLARVVSDRIEIVADADRLNGGQVRAVVADGGTAAWVGVGHELLRIEDDRVESFGVAEGFPDAPVSGLELQRGGELWVATNGGGLVRLVGGVVAGRWTSSDGLPVDNIMAVIVDREDQLWIGTNGGGVIRQRADGTWDRRDTENGLCGSLVRGILEDREGGVWLTTIDGGVCRLYDQPFRAFTEDDGLGSPVVLGVLGGRDGSIWFGTAGAGLGRLRDGRVTMIGVDDGMPHGVVISLAEQKNGTLWAGTTGGGLVRLAPGGSPEVIGIANGLAADIVTALMVDRRDRLWVGTAMGGVDMIDDAGIHHIPLPEWIHDVQVFNLTEDSSGSLWVGTRSAGAIRLTEGQIEVFDSTRGPAMDVILDIIETAPGTVLVGTANAGVVHIRNGEVKACGRADGLWDDVVMRILDDGQGWLWMTSNRGVFRVRRDELEAFFDERIERVHCEAFDRSDGLPNNECNGGFQPAGSRGVDGRLWFPTQGGLTVVNPSRLPENSPLPPVVIESVQSDAGPVAVSPEIRLARGARSLTVHYTIPTFDHSDELRFRYRLDGLDPNWIEAQDRRIAFYTNLPPGRFSLHVEARTPGGLATVQPATVDIEIPGWFYQRRWFPVVAVLFAGFTGFAISRRALLRSRRRQRELEGLIRGRHDAEAALVASQERLHQAQKMEAVGRLAGGVAHDFNNLLMTISASAELLAASLDPADPRRGRTETILHASDHAAGLTRQLLAFSRQQVVECRDIDVIDHVESLSPILDRLLGEDVRLVLELVPTAVWIHGDPTQIEQILLNLAANARDAMTLGGTLTIRIRLATAHEARDVGASQENMVVIEVEDTGGGISADNLERVFEPFFTTKEAGKGTGLGLATVYATVEALNGRIEVASEIGQGTRFRIWLPTIPSPSNIGPDGDDDERLALDCAVLLVEDDPGVRVGLADQLRSVGATVWEAEGVETATAFVAESRQRIDVALSDVVMPDGSGRELAGQLHLLRPDLPVVLMSGHTDDRLVHHGVESGEIDFLQKPFRLATAVIALRRAIDRSGTRPHD